MVNAIRDLGVGGNLADVELEMMYNSVAESPDEMVVRKFVETVRVCFVGAGLCPLKPCPVQGPRTRSIHLFERGSGQTDLRCAWERPRIRGVLLQKGV